MFSKTVVDLDLCKHHGVEELFNYINNKDAEIDKVKILMKKANRELRIDGRQLFIRKSSGRDKEVENRICITRR
mgnify:CR=1 FL=1